MNDNSRRDLVGERIHKLVNKLNATVNNFEKETNFKIEAVNYNINSKFSVVVNTEGK